MKLYTRFLALFSIALPVAAGAAEQPTWRAELQEFTSDGHPIVNIMATHTILVMNQEGKRVTSFDLSEGLDPNSKKHFSILARYTDRCGSTRYLATLVSYRSRTLELLSVKDHRERRCDDAKPAIWEVERSAAKTARRYYRGTPGAPTQNPLPAACAAAGDRLRVCTMLYLPVVCEVKTVGGKPLNPPIRVSGGNPCFAEGAVRSVLCAQGIDPDMMKDEEMLCSVEQTPVCALPMCAAPPEGCTVTSSNETDANGCPLYPCGLWKCPLPGR